MSYTAQPSTVDQNGTNNQNDMENVERTTPTSPNTTTGELPSTIVCAMPVSTDTLTVRRTDTSGTTQPSTVHQYDTNKQYKMENVEQTTATPPNTTAAELHTTLCKIPVSTATLAARTDEQVIGTDDERRQTSDEEKSKKKIQKSTTSLNISSTSKIKEKHIELPIADKSTDKTGKFFLNFYNHFFQLFLLNVFLLSYPKNNKCRF
jgi:hypothetical protein